MYRTQQMHAFTALMALWIGISLSTARAADYRWIGGGADAYWSTLDNWEEQVGGDWQTATNAPGADDVVYLDDAAPDAAQTVALDANVTLTRLVMDATGNRTYAITNAVSEDFTLTMTHADWITQAADTSCNLYLQVRTFNTLSDSVAVHVNSTSGARIVVQRNMNHSGGSGSETFGIRSATGATGIFELQARVFGNRFRPFVRSRVLLANAGTASAIGMGFWPDDGTILAQTDPVGTLPTGNLFNRNVRFRAFNAGAGVDVTILANGFNRRGPVFLDNPYTEYDSGILTLSITSLFRDNSQGIPRVQMADRTRLDLRGNQEAIQEGDDADWARGIHGEGALTKTAGNSVSLISHTNTYTGGTFVEFATLRLHQVNLSAFSIAGQLGPGLLQIADGATFDLNGIDQTVARLQGAGTVQLGGATFSVTNGVSPGTNSVGMLTVEGSGELVLAGASVFDFVDAGAFDQVAFTGDADLTLGGTLEVQVPEGYDNTRTRYTIFALNGGTIHGAFDAILVPDDMWAEIDTSSGDVELILSPPGGTTILIR